MNQNAPKRSGESEGGLFWKITLTVLCVVLGGVLALYLLRVL